MPFRSRSRAGRKLAKALAGYKMERPVVLALARGGVPVAAEVCAALNAPLDLISRAQDRSTFSTRTGDGSRRRRPYVDHCAQ